MTAERQPELNILRPFRRADAVAAGFEHELRTKKYRRLLHGIYLSSKTAVTPVVRAEAALIAFPTGWASHVTAGRIYNLPLPPIPEEHVTVMRSPARHVRAEVRVHEGHPHETRVVDGIRVSGPKQVFVELATLLPLVDLVVVGDHMVRQGLVALPDLVAYCEHATGPGAGGARQAVAYVRPRVDSPMESRLRMLLVLAGLPEPVVNLTVGDGSERRKYDLTYLRSRTIVEYDGRQHIERVQQWESDLSRREKIDDDAWRILVIVAKDVYKTPEATLKRIHRVLKDRGQPDVPRRLWSRWKKHFPDRSG